MKKFLSFLLIATFTFGFTALPTAEVQAQRTFISQYSNALDTVLTGNLTKYMTLAADISSNFSTIEIHVDITKISGTVGGSLTVQTRQTASGTWGTADGTSAYTITDGTQVKIFKLTNWCSKEVRLAFVGTGTMSAQVKATCIPRKLPVNTKQ